MKIAIGIAAYLVACFALAIVIGRFIRAGRGEDDDGIHDAYQKCDADKRDQLD